MKNNPINQKTHSEHLREKAAELETVAMGLIEESQKQLQTEKDLWIRDVLELRRQELRNILTTLLVPNDNRVSEAETRILSLKSDPYSVGLHSHALPARKPIHPENGSKAA